MAYNDELMARMGQKNLTCPYNMVPGTALDSVGLSALVAGYYFHFQVAVWSINLENT